MAAGPSNRHPSVKGDAPLTISGLDEDAADEYDRRLRSVVQHNEPMSLPSHEPTEEWPPHLLSNIAMGIGRGTLFPSETTTLIGRDLHMMNSEEFTQFLNELRAEYDLPPKADKGSRMTPSEELEDFEGVLTEEDCASLQQHEDL